MSPLPPNANLNQLRIQAKEILRAYQRREPIASEVLRHLERFVGMSDTAILDSNVSLQVVQHALARKYGIRDWSSLQDQLRLHAGICWYRDCRDDAKRIVASYREGDLDTLARVTRGLADVADGPTLDAEISGYDGREFCDIDAFAVIANEQGNRWPHVIFEPANAAGPLIDATHAAADAVRQRDHRTLAQILDSEPAIAKARLIGDSQLKGTHRDRSTWADVPVRAGDVRSTSLLHNAVKQDSVELVELLLEFGADPNSVGWEGVQLRFPLDLGRARVVARLVDRGADVQLAETALDGALRHGNQETARLLAQAGANHTIFTAVFSGDVRALQESVRDPGALNARHPVSRLSAIEEAYKSQRPDLAAVLLEHGAIASPLALAAAGRDDELRLVIQQSPKLLNRVWTPDGDTLLGFSGVANQLATMRMLLDAGADPSGTLISSLLWNFDGRNERQEAIELLLDAGADPNQAVLQSLRFGRTEILERLEAHGADITGHDEQGQNWLYGLMSYASRNRIDSETLIKSIRFLTGRGVSAHARSSDGSTPADVAKSSDGWSSRQLGYQRVVELLHNSE